MILPLLSLYARRKRASKVLSTGWGAIVSGLAVKLRVLTLRVRRVFPCGVRYHTVSLKPCIFQQRVT